MNPLELKPIDGAPDQMAALQSVFESAPDYSLRIMGHPPGPAEAQSTCMALPPGKTAQDKHVFGIYLDREMIGCADLIRGYPDEKTAMLGLLLLSKAHQGKGHGAQAYFEVEKVARSWPEIIVVRIGVVGTNDVVIPFWEKMGFVDTGIRKPYQYDKLTSEHFVFEKKIAGPSSKVELHKHDPNWITLFNREAANLKNILGDCLVEVHHVGSTAVPGLVAKPIIDILGVDSNHSDLEKCRDLLAGANYNWLGERGLPGRRYFTKEDSKGETRLVHLHIYEKGHLEIETHLRFRDILRSNAEIRRKYQSLKLKLHTEYASDRARYTVAKAPFIQGVLKRGNKNES